MSGKSQTIGDFAVLAGHYGGHLGWSGTNRENRERFYFPDTSQIGDFPDISAKSGTFANSIIPDRLGFSRNMKTTARSPVFHPFSSPAFCRSNHRVRRSSI